MSRRGHFTSSKVLYAGLQTATVEIASHLNIVPGVRIAVLRRVRMADDKPIALENAMLIEACCPQLLNGHDFARESLYQVLREQYHLHLTHAEQTIEARHATAEEALALDIQPGSPVLAITRVTYTSENRPVEYVLSAYRGDRYKLRAILRHI
jgi:GntR family transcriptional regulator